MAKKYPFRRRKHPRRSRLTEPALESMPVIPDQRVVEGMMRKQTEQILGVAATATPLSQAQEIAYQAFGAQDQQERIRLAKRCVEISPDCADAYVVLAENAPTRKEAFDYYEKGVAAGERAIGPDTFQDSVGHFWGLMDTRPYMRPRRARSFALGDRTTR